MATSISARKSLYLPISVSIQSMATAVAVIAAIGTIAAIIMQSDILMYICGTISLAIVYSLERNNTENTEGGEL